MDNHNDLIPTVNSGTAEVQPSGVMAEQALKDKVYSGTTQHEIMAETLARQTGASTSAASMRERLGRYIYEFESELDLDHEIGAELVSFGRTMTFHITDIGTSGPDLITFYGVTDDGGKLQLVQHITQLSVLLMAVQKIDENPRRIGFIPTEHAKPFI
jgi:hypothetical protein